MTDSISSEFERLAPWVTRFEIGGQVYGGAYDAAHDAAERINQFATCFPHAASVLELGSLEGGHTVCLAGLPGVERVVAIEGREENVARARLVVDLLEITNVEILTGDLQMLDLTPLGRFDAVFNCGLLYHLPEPWLLLQRIAAVTSGMYLSTHYCRDGEATATAGGYTGSSYTEHGIADVLSGLDPSSFWPERAELLRMLGDVGFTNTRVTFDEPDFPHGPLICLAATRAPTHNGS